MLRNGETATVLSSVASQILPEVTGRHLQQVGTFVWINPTNVDDAGVVLTTKAELPRIRELIREHHPSSFESLLDVILWSGITYFKVSTDDDSCDVFEFDNECDDPWKEDVE